MHDAWSQFWSMGGYAGYVWTSYGIAAVVVIANVLGPLMVHRRVVRKIREGEYDD